MTLTVAITINVLLDVALLSLLAFVMSRPAKLTPHRTETVLPAVAPTAHAKRPRPTRRAVRDASQLQPAID
jgi:hypothetical protein